MTLALTCLIVYGLIAGVVWRSRYAYEQTYLAGKRAGLKQAIDAAKDRGDVALMVAPPGMLIEGAVRAQAAHQIERDLRDLLTEVR